MKEVVNKIKRYREIKADIVSIDIRMQELEEEMLGVSAMPIREKTGKTYKIGSIVETQAEKHLEEKDRLLYLKVYNERQLARIDNALSILNEDERDIVQTVLIDQKKYGLLEIKYNRTYSRIKQIESKAIKKMEKYLS